MPVTSGPPLDQVGNKVLKTQLLMRFGLRVPMSWAVPFWVMDAYLENREGTLDLLENEMMRVLPQDRLFAVRSSAEGEDESVRSFAGQFVSVLNVPLDQLITAVEKVWRSLNDRKLKGYSAGPGRMGVLIQVMVPPSISGVSFSCDPLSGRRLAIVEAVEGEGSRLVQEGLTPWRYEMTSDLVLLTGEGELDRKVLWEVVRTTFRLRDRTGGELDLEWVYDGRRLHWVQMRGLTGLKGLDRYTNTFSKEFLPGMIKPLVWSINVPINSRAWVRLLSELTGREDLRAENLAKSFYYRAYFNMGEFAKVWEAMGMPDDLLERMVLMQGGGKMVFRPTPKLILSLGRVMLFLWSKRRWFSDVEAALHDLRSDYEERLQEDLTALSDGELMGRIDGLLETAVTSAYYTVLCIMSSSLVTRIWHRILQRRGLDVNLLSLRTGGDGGYPEERLRELRPYFQDLDPQLTYQELCRTKGREDVCMKLQEFLAEYGHYSESGNDFSVPPWRETPDLVLDILRMSPERERAKSERARGPFLSGLQLQEAKFRSYRERMGSVYTRHYGLFRGYFLEVGRRLVERGRLERADQVFLLDLEEVRDSLLKEWGGGLSLVVSREEEMERLKGICLPSVIFGNEPPPAHREVSNVLKGTPSSGGYYRGRARVVKGLADMKSLEKGDVLVIPYSDVGWTPFFHLAGAVVSESGGILSHSAIIAREYGIPAVVSVPGAMGLRDGVVLEIDGYRGEVIVVGDSGL